MNGATDPADVVRITRGAPGPEELAAVLLVLRALTAAWREDGGVREVRTPGWAARHTPPRRAPWTPHPWHHHPAPWP